MFERYLAKQMTPQTIGSGIRSFRHDSDFGVVERQDFRGFFTLREILSISKLRNGANGRPFSTNELFGGELIYKALIHGAPLMHIASDIFVIFDGETVEEIVNIERLIEVFPRGLPRNRRQAVTWLSYVTWLAKEKYGYKR